MQSYGGFRLFPNILARSSWSCCDGVGWTRQRAAKGQNPVVSKEIFPIILWYQKNSFDLWSKILSLENKNKSIFILYSSRLFVSLQR